MRKLIKNVKIFMENMKKCHVSAYSAQTSYFIIMSVFPFVLILLSIVRFTALTEEMLMNMFSEVLPSIFLPIIENIADELYERANGILSISVLLALWSSAKSVLALTNGLNVIYSVNETRNYILLRLRSACYTAAFIIAIMISLVLMVFGEKFNIFIGNHFPIIASAFQYILDWRLIMVLAYQTVIFTLIYKFLPNRKTKYFAQLPGAIFSSIGWNIFSYLFSIYIKYGTLTYTYGSLTTLIIVMIWLYFCMYMIFIGALINRFFENKKLNFLKKIRKKA